MLTVYRFFAIYGRERMTSFNGGVTGVRSKLHPYGLVANTPVRWGSGQDRNEPDVSTASEDLGAIRNECEARSF
ncbi:MAG: hypothetical protein J5747_08405 [Spirochaetaceae bacterium]|nr:hypothetical protein [Spirochaetaceae bacterium]